MNEKKDVVMDLCERQECRRTGRREKRADLRRRGGGVDRPTRDKADGPLLGFRRLHCWLVCLIACLPCIIADLHVHLFDFHHSQLPVRSPFDYPPLRKRVFSVALASLGLISEEQQCSFTSLNARSTPSFTPALLGSIVQEY
ncbi:hypothetical protein E2C01_034074 [Portunus trituberculatus]|uniref:Uncharacterized protein n=1 Tax=Portunus trituberculatus TaxID=210409 RepID=A0A5B7F7J0_PORTR|nr:hypothetical protein [Portunus trituberculatus]